MRTNLTLLSTLISFTLIDLIFGHLSINTIQTGTFFTDRKGAVRKISIPVPSPTGNPKTDVKQIFGYTPDEHDNHVDPYPALFIDPLKHNLSLPGVSPFSQIYKGIPLFVPGE